MVVLGFVSLVVEGSAMYAKVVATIFITTIAIATVEHHQSPSPMPILLKQGLVEMLLRFPLARGLEKLAC